MLRVCCSVEVRRLYWRKTIVPILYATLTFFKSVPPNRILDWNPLPQGSFMGSGCVSNIAPSEWWHMPKPCSAKRNVEKITEEDDDSDVVDTEANVQDMDAGTAGFTNYMNERLGPDPGLQTHSIPNAPNCDALNNEDIRLGDKNGIHHIALVICTCQGHENITTDLIFAGWVPTSFVQIRTIFTTAVLDHFQYCNLEMRSSAYEFFQLLQQITNSLSPSKVMNLYHELRRLSRLW